MKKIALFILLICPEFFAILMAQHYTDHLYTYTDSIFNNPERGFYKYTSRGSASGSLSLSTLENFYNDGYTLIYRIYYLQDYVNQPISKDYLDKIREDFQIVRESGIKVVLRFAYTENSTPPYGDATPEQVQEHIAQLKPILQENTDVIAVLQAGFIGAWGEWYYTDYFATGSPDNVTPEDLEERSDLVYSLLDALPASRQVQLRYVGYKMDFFGDIPITENEAYSGIAKSRIAHHNDCFLSSSNDVGTYHSAYDRTYLKTDSKYTAVGGETCRWFEPRSNCDTALVEMGRYHWSFINIDYFGTTIQNWKNDGCFNDIQRKLGYRYQLMSSSIQDSSRQGGSFHGTLQLINTGFSNPYNPRAVELVMRNRATKEEYFLNLKTDIRKTPAGDPLILEFEGGIPTDAENGTYDLFLNLPDPMISLKNNPRPRYSIRLANENTWEASTGFNRLFHTFVIHPSSSASEYTGTDFFSDSEQRNMPFYEDILIDGKDDDWLSFALAYQSGLNQHVNSIKIYNNNQYLYFLVKGTALYPNSRLIIDADNNPLTGMNYKGWETNGVDFMMENSSLYTYSGENGLSIWSWQFLDQVNTVMNDSVAEIAVALDLLGIPGDTVMCGYMNGNADFSITEYLPAEAEPLLAYKIDGLIDHTPEIFSTHYANNAIIYWGIREDDSKSRIIERSDGNQYNFKVISILSPGVVAYKDLNLFPDETYYYRSFLTNFQTVTPYTPVVAEYTDSEIFRYSEITIDGSANDWNAMPPVLSLYDNNTYTLRIFADTKNLNFLVTGNKISGFELYLETDFDPLTGASVEAWTTDGIDYRISHDSLFSFQHEWVYNSSLSNYVFTDSVIELSIPFNEISLGNIATIRLGIDLYVETDELLLPFSGNSLEKYNRILPTAPPASFHLVSSSIDPASRIIIRWDKCTTCDGHVIEKLDEDKGVFEFLVELDYNAYQYIDDSLENHTEYSYRMYSYNPAGRSDYTRTLTGLTHDVGIIENEEDGRFQVYTDPATRILIVRIIDPDLFLTSIDLYDFSGKEVYTAQCNTGEQELIIPVQDLNTGIYLLLLNFQNSQYSEKILIY